MTKAIKSSVRVGELATGQALTVPLYTFSGSELSSPSVYIQANVHGAEVDGKCSDLSTDDLVRRLSSTR
jgi:predicted deacylase